MIKTLQKTDNGIYYKFFIYDSYEEFTKDSSLFFRGREYLYCLELDGGYAIKIGFSANILSRIKNHCKRKNSPFKDKVGRIGVLGPLRGGLDSEDWIHAYMSSMLTTEYGSFETYTCDKVFKESNVVNGNTFDAFHQYTFPIIQSLCRSKEDEEGYPCGFDLILEDKTLSNKEKKLLEKEEEFNIAIQAAE